jgi:hypothetical protein
MVKFKLTVINNQSIDFLLLYFILAQMYVIVIVGVGCGVVMAAVVAFNLEVHINIYYNI